MDARGSGDATTVPDCACPPDDYVIDAVVDGEAQRFSAPYALWLYCEETTVQLVRSPCTDVYRLSACAGPGQRLPCLYVAVDVTRGPLIGHYVDSTGQTWDLISASMDVTSETGRATVGTFDATFVSPRDAGPLAVSGRFRACTTRMPACRR